MSNHWGVEVTGTDPDEAIATDALKPPFDPYLAKIEANGKVCLTLRSADFDGLEKPSEVRKVAASLLLRLNVALGATADTDPLALGVVLDLSDPSKPRRHMTIEVPTARIRIRGYPATVSITASDGRIVEPPPRPSPAQRWMRAAALSPGLALAIDYMSDHPGWVELSNARECLLDHKLAVRTIGSTALNLFNHTANSEVRHRKGKFDPPKRPMPLREARALMTTWLEAAVEEVLSAHAN